MAPGRSYFEGPLGRLLAAYVLEVHGKLLQGPEQAFGGDVEGLALDLAKHASVQQIKNLEQRGGGIDIHSFDNGCLGRIRSRLATVK